jgi:hypothetical protein
MDGITPEDVALFMKMDEDENANVPHVVRIASATTGDLPTYYGPFINATAARRVSERLIAYWDRDEPPDQPAWTATIHWLIGPDHELWPTDI